MPEVKEKSKAKDKSFDPLFLSGHTLVELLNNSGVVSPFLF